MTTNIDNPNFIWWTGVVEDIADPLETGRVKVRIFGYHNPNRTELEVKELPFATPIMPVSNAGVNGIMENHSLVCGSMVVGYFADGEDGQIPMILGSIAGQYPSGHKFLDTGFEDPNKNWPRDKDKPDGYAGKGEPDVSRLARRDAESHYNLKNRRSNRETGVLIAKAPDLSEDGFGAAGNNRPGTEYENKTWDEPHPRGNPTDNDPAEDFEPKYPEKDAAPTGDETSIYPFNIVNETRAGIVHERDNSPKNIRIHEFHPAGTWYEIHSDGSKVENITKNNYQIVAGNDSVLIRGKCNVTIEGDCNMLVKGNYVQEVDGDYHLSVAGTKYEKINGNHMKVVGTDQNYTIAGNRQARVSKDDMETITINQTKSVGGTKRTTVNGSVKENYGSFLSTNIKAHRITGIGENDKTTIGQDLVLAAGGVSKLMSAKDQVLMTAKNQFILVGAKFVGDADAPIKAKGFEDRDGTNTDYKQVIEAEGSIDTDAPEIDIDATTSMEIDAPELSIDGPAGNITSNSVTLHTHTHPQNDGNDAGGGADTSAPNAG